MDDGLRLNSIWNFLFVLQKRLDRNEAIVFSPRAFARAIEKEQARGNPFALRFPLYNTICGKSCPDFQQGLTMALHAGSICWLSPGYRHFIIYFTEREAKLLLDPLSKKDQVGVMRVVVRYCKNIFHRRKRQRKNRAAT